MKSQKPFQGAVEASSEGLPVLWVNIYSVGDWKLAGEGGKERTTRSGENPYARHRRGQTCTPARGEGARAPDSRGSSRPPPHPPIPASRARGWGNFSPLARSASLRLDLCPATSGPGQML